VVAGATDWLAPDGWLLVETGEPQLEASLALLAAAGLTTRTWRAEETGGLVVGGRHAAPGPSPSQR